MKVLEDYLLRLGLKASYGIVYNCEGIKEIKYWDDEGNIKILNHIPFKFSPGITTFKFSKGQLFILDHSFLKGI